MVRNGHARRLPDLGYRNPDQPRLGVEVFDYGAMASKAPEMLARPHRIDFHQIILVTGGRGTAMVDFVDHPCTAGTLIHVVPGQVQRLPQPLGPGRLRAVMAVFTPTFPPRLENIDLPSAGGAWRLGRAELTRLRRAMDDLSAEYRHAVREQPAADLTAGLLRHLVGALLLRVARLSTPDPAGPVGTVYRTFRRELERSYATTRSTTDYAARTGYAPRTLSRACVAATGRTAKQVVDDRVVLEAKRLLVHTDLSAAAISRRLGFTEPTNFGKFFTRAAGLTPDTFRQHERHPLGSA